MSTGESDDSCGYRQDKSSFEQFVWKWDSEMFVDTVQWDEDDNSVVCLRDPWTDHDRCVWHAEIKDKSAVDFKTLRANGPERLDGAYLPDVELDDQFSFAGCWLRGVNLSRAHLSYSDLSEAHFSYSDLSEAHLHRADLSEAHLRGADLSEADLSRADLSDAHLIHADLSDADLSRADLSNANLSRADLSEAHLRGVDLSEAHLRGVDLSEADLRGVDLSEADLSQADLSDANLVWANLSEAFLFRADLSEANLRWADLSGTDLRRTNLFKIDVYSLQIDDISDVTVDSQTKVSSRIPLRSGFRHVSILVWDLDIWSLPGQATEWDGRARGYERLRRIFQEKGLDDHHRKLYSYQRRARAKEALRTGRFIQWIGNYLSRILTGHGVRISRVLLWTAVVILVPWYWYGLVEGWVNESLDGGPLYYSIVTFVTSPPHPIPETEGSIDLLLTTVDRQSLNQAVVLFQTYVGTVLIILLGYVLGNRDPI